MSDPTPPRRSILGMLGSLLPRRRGRGPAGRVIRPWREDSLRLHPTVGLTPQRALAMLHAADDGQPAQQFELLTEMLQKWPRLSAVEATRRMALTGLDWELAPADRDETSRRAAAWCREQLAALERFRDVLEHLAAAIGLGISVAELVWERGRLVDLVPVPHSRLMADPHEPWRLRVRTQREPSLGVALDESPGKWLIHRPRCQAGRSFEGGLLRRSVLLFVAQSLSLKDWLITSQSTAAPIRVARVDAALPENDRRALLRMLEDLGRDAVAVVGRNVELELLEGRGEPQHVFAPLQEYCNTEVTILWLGQHLTTDIRTSGSRAAAEVHDRVREDLLAGDMVDEAKTLRRDLLAPLTRARFGPGVQPPHFRRALVQSVDTRSLAQTLAVAVSELGLRVPARWVHQALGIPEAAEDEPTLSAGRRS